MITGLITVGINIVLNLLLVGPLEQGGLALATSIAGLCGLILSLWIMHRKAKVSLPIHRLSSSVTRVLIAAVTMGLVVRWSYPPIESMLPMQITIAELGRILIAVVEGAIVYTFSLWVLEVPELYAAVEKLRRTFINRLRYR